MTIRRTLTTAVLLALSCGALLGPVRAEEPAKKSRADSVAEAAELVAQARRATAKDKAAVAQMEQALDLLRPFADEVRERCARGDASAMQNGRAFAATFNAALTAAHYHEMRVKDDYVTVPLPKYFGGARLVGQIVFSPDWIAKIKEAHDQENCHIWQKRPNGKSLRLLKLWQYRWDTVYSDVGGENYKGLAKMMHEIDRDSVLKKGRKASKRVTSKRLNKKINRAQYYYVRGFDVDLETTVHSEDYYFKGPNRSFNLEVNSYVDAQEGDDACTAWRLEDEDPELRALLDSIRTRDD